MTVILNPTIDAGDSDAFTVTQGQTVTVHMYATSNGGIINEAVIAPILILNANATYDPTYERPNIAAAVKSYDRPIGVSIPGTYIVRKPETIETIGFEVTS